ncbi:MAG: hypothetical protein QHH10_01215 [Peptococcaceae bacterium]|nr:hypothetical protein [Peptococcaceae bacterium]MDH7523915.1 hypothetical protein [Peptococcaceae bacterium]
MIRPTTTSGNPAPWNMRVIKYLLLRIQFRPTVWDYLRPMDQSRREMPEREHQGWLK